jgi:hypothetical protein
MLAQRDVEVADQDQPDPVGVASRGAELPVSPERTSDREENAEPGRSSELQQQAGQVRFAIRQLHGRDTGVKRR